MVRRRQRRGTGSMKGKDVKEGQLRKGKGEYIFETKNKINK